MNIIFSVDEVWGGTSWPGTTNEYYRELFSSKILIDIKPAKLVPTWRNEHTGQEEIASRLDRVLVYEGLLSVIVLYRSWVEFPFISNHAPVLLQLELPPFYKAYPFKLNAHWLNDQDFMDLVYKIWKDPVFLSEGGKKNRIVWKLQELKKQKKIRYKENLARNKAKLVSHSNKI